MFLIVDAFREMGTNADPFLAGIFLERNSVWNDLYVKIYPKLPQVCQKQLTQPMSRREKLDGALFILQMLGYREKVFDELKGVLADRSNPNHVYAITVIGTWTKPRDVDWVPILIDCLNETDTFVQAQAAYALSNIRHPAEAAVPALTSAAASTDVAVRMNAAWALWRITGQTNSASTLVEILKTKESLRARSECALHLFEMNFKDPSLIPIYVEMLPGAIVISELDGPALALSKYGPLASNAVPILVQELNSGRSGGREVILRALVEIDPATAAKYYAR